MFNHTDLVRLEDLKPELKVYTAHSLGGSSYVQTIIIKEVLGDWVKVSARVRDSIAMTKSTMSLYDLGIIPNSLDGSKTFHSFESAKEYLTFLRELG
jgi:hypothetical protein